MRKLVLSNLLILFLFVLTGCSISQNIPVQRMAEKAKFETYTFSPNPPWTAQAQITELNFFGQQTFTSIYRADDGRHVVLAQDSSYKKKLEPKIKEQGQIVYTSPGNFKLWRGGREKWFSKILLESADHVLDDAPSDNRTGCAIESPANSFLLLAINGPVTEQQLHQLVNSLIPAAKYKTSDWEN
jgi:hypothetical protein